jgi:hypothetical protein
MTVLLGADPVHSGTSQGAVGIYCPVPALSAPDVVDDPVPAPGYARLTGGVHDMGEVMALGGFEFLVVAVIWLIMSLIVGLILYGIIRCGVKHGMRSYYAGTAPRPTDGPAGDPRR